MIPFYFIFLNSLLFLLLNNNNANAQDTRYPLGETLAGEFSFHFFLFILSFSFFCFIFFLKKIIKITCNAKKMALQECCNLTLFVARCLLANSVVLIGMERLPLNSTCIPARNLFQFNFIFSYRIERKAKRNKTKQIFQSSFFAKCNGRTIVLSLSQLLSI